MPPESPTAAAVAGEAATLPSSAVVGVGRRVQLVPSGLVSTVPLSPVTRFRPAKEATPWRSLVVGRGSTAYQLTPNVLMVWLVITTFVPTMFVTVMFVSAYGLKMRLPWVPAAPRGWVVP